MSASWYELRPRVQGVVFFACYNMILFPKAKSAALCCRWSIIQVFLVWCFYIFVYFLFLQADSSSGYSNTGMEIAVVSDMIENCLVLFEVQEKEIERDAKIREAMEKISLLNQVTSALQSSVSIDPLQPLSSLLLCSYLWFGTELKNCLDMVVSVVNICSGTLL